MLVGSNSSKTQGSDVYKKSTSGSPASITNQLVAFEKLQRHAISRFSKERVYSMLKTVMHHLREENKQAEKDKKDKENSSQSNEEKDAGQNNKPEDKDDGTDVQAEPETETQNKSPDAAETNQPHIEEQNEIKKQSIKTEIKLQSVRQVRDVIKVFQLKEQDGKATEAESNAIKNFETFINDLSYLKQLKEYYGENIYNCLYRHYFDPADFVNLRNTDQDIGLQSRNESPPGKSRMQKGTGKKAKKVITEDEQLEINKISLSRTARELQDIQNKWHGLMLDSNLNLDYFDQDSHYELMQFVGYSAFESVLRLVPDVFVKCYKSIEMAREWWSLAQKVYKDRLPLNWVPSPIKKSPTPVPVATPIPKSPAVKTPEVEKDPKDDPNKDEIVKAELSRQTENIQKHITEIGETIERNEQQLETIGIEMDTLKVREMRSENLTSTCERMDMDLKKLEEELQKFMVERKRAQDQIANTEPGSKKYNELMEKIRMHDAEINKKQNQIKMIQFERSLKQEDYLLELEIKPSFILFFADMKEKMAQIKQDVVSKRMTKMKLERQLTLIQSNADKMKALLQRYIKSASSRANPKLTQDFERITRELEEDLQSLRTLDSRGSGITISTETDVSLADYLPDGILDDEEFDPWERQIQEPSRKPIINKTKTGKTVPNNNLQKRSRSKVLQEA